MLRIVILLVISALSLSWLEGHASGQEIAPGVIIKSKRFDAPISEQPYFAFAQKAPFQLEADRAFLLEADATGKTRKESANQFSRVAWQAMIAGKYDLAARRLNQAWLLDPDRSDIAHGFAIIVYYRFNDVDYADDLFRSAARLREPRATLSADHGRHLLKAGRPAEALPLLQAAARVNPEWAFPKLNLALAYEQLRMPKEACAVAASITGRQPGDIGKDMVRLRKSLSC